jgi:hypothetical protein
MKKALNVDEELFREAKAACGAATDAETVRLGLEALPGSAAYERLRALRGSDPHAQGFLGAAKSQRRNAEGLNPRPNCSLRSVQNPFNVRICRLPKSNRKLQNHTSGQRLPVRVLYEWRVYPVNRDARCHLRSIESGACTDWTG